MRNHCLRCFSPAATNRSFFTSLRALLLLAVVATVALRAEPVALPSGVTYELIGSYDTARLDSILTDELAEFADAAALGVTFPKAKYAVDLYRVVYPSVIPELQNRPTLASGLVAVPQSGAAQMPVVSYQHGTVFSKTAVPSNPEESYETRLMLAHLAGQGYMVIAADYFGKGQSTDKDSYLVKESTQQACLDNYRASQAVSRALGIEQGALFLSGWSQGGWATMAFLNRLESVGIVVAGAAPMAAPNDLYAAISGWVHTPKDTDSFFLPALLVLQVNAYAEYYDLPGLDVLALKPEYLEAGRKLYLNEISWTEAMPQLPTKVNDLLRESFIAAGTPGNARYWQLALDNEVYRWRSVTPLRAYYGSVDEVVSPYVATLGIGYQIALGHADAQAVDAGSNANHRGAFVYGVAMQKAWFDSLQKDAQ